MTGEENEYQSQPQREVNDYRKELWIGVAISVAEAEASNAHNARDRRLPGEWADAALDAFDRRFSDD